MKWVKECRSVVALAALSYVAVALWMRLLEYVPSQFFWLNVVVRWSVLAVLVASIVVAQLLFGKRFLSGLALRTVAACVLSGVVVFCVLMSQPKFMYVLAKIAMGEGGWSHPIGEVEMTVRGHRVVYEARVGNVVYASYMPVNGLMLISKGDLPDGDLALMDRLVVYRDELCAASRLCVLRMPFVPDPTICYGAISLRPRLKAELFSAWEMRDVDGFREYDCELADIRHGGHVVLRIPNEYFASLKRE